MAGSRGSPGGAGGQHRGAGAEEAAGQSQIRRLPWGRGEGPEVGRGPPGHPGPAPGRQHRDGPVGLPRDREHVWDTERSPAPTVGAVPRPEAPGSSWGGGVRRGDGAGGPACRVQSRERREGPGEQAEPRAAPLRWEASGPTPQGPPPPGCHALARAGRGASVTRCEPACPSGGTVPSGHLLEPGGPRSGGAEGPVLGVGRAAQAPVPSAGVRGRRGGPGRARAVTGAGGEGRGSPTSWA